MYQFYIKKQEASRLSRVWAHARGEIRLLQFSLFAPQNQPDQLVFWLLKKQKIGTCEKDQLGPIFGKLIRLDKKIL